MFKRSRGLLRRRSRAGRHRDAFLLFFFLSVLVVVFFVRSAFALAPVVVRVRVRDVVFERPPPASSSASASISIGSRAVPLGAAVSAAVCHDDISSSSSSTSRISRRGGAWTALAPSTPRVPASTSATTTPDARVVASVTVSGGQRLAATAAVTSTSRTTISTTSSIAGLLRLGTGLEARAGFVLVFAGAAGFKFTPLRSRECAVLSGKSS